ncbi:MAG: DUF364 domain-containing protein, partial [Clostridiaceae bacterium]|nr:DUF364 domain-containing protein [Clostridiaceae bacterium]
MISDRLVDFALSRAEGRRVKDVRAGLSYCCLKLDDGATGLAYTFRQELGPYCGILDEAGSLIGRELSELLPWLKSPNRLKAALGLAGVNALCNQPGPAYDKGNVTLALDLAPDDRFGMVGAFGPILKAVKEKTQHIYIFDQAINKEGQILPGSDLGNYLPTCQVIVITATSLINQSLDGVLGHCQKARQVFWLGPYSPLCPQAVQGSPLTHLGGA